MKRLVNLLGVDTGGTFTDFVYYDGQSLTVHKVLSTPKAPEQAILQGIEDLGLDFDKLLVIHGSTVATNAVLQSRGVKTVFITNRGFADMLTIGRQARRELYNLQPSIPMIPVPAELCIETGGRLNADGAVLETLSDQDLEQLKQQIRKLQPQAVAINLLFSYIDNSHELQIEAVLKEVLSDEVFISRSSDVLAEYREYERGMATWLNAWVGPLVQQYLSRLQLAVRPAQVSVIQSSGGTAGIEYAGRHAVDMLLSGPAGGLAGARFTAACNDIDRIMTFDMGGTSSDVALIDKKINLTTEGHIGDWPVAVPMVDMHTIGAGGGSIARVDAGGLLQVGPESAGSVPGPACYGNGSKLATVTDANLVLGRILPDAFLGGSLALDADAAFNAVRIVADDLDTDIQSAAEGIVRVANEHMSAALRVISVQRGLDPRQFTLVSFGGAGGLHVCALAESLDMSNILVPVYAGVLSALGMLVAPRSRLLSQTVNLFPEQSTDAQTKMLAAYQRMQSQLKTELQDEGVAVTDQTVEFLADLRYQGQSSTLTLSWRESMEELISGFHQGHEQRYGHRLDEIVEVVNLRVQVSGPVADINLQNSEQGFVKNITSTDKMDKQYTKTAENTEIKLSLDHNMQIINRADLTPNFCVTGPALIIEPVATTYISTGWQCQCKKSGNLAVQRI